MNRYRYGSDSDAVPLWVPVTLILVFYVISLIIAMNVDEGKSIRAAEDLGYTDITVTDRDIWFIGFKGCDKSDSALFTVHGTGPDGKERDLTVCAGIFKGGTIRSR